MRKKICDRCSKEIKDTFVWDPKSVYTQYDIKAITHSTFQHPCVSNGCRTIDLCPSCEKEFSDWLANEDKEAQ